MKLVLSTPAVAQWTLTEKFLIFLTLFSLGKATFSPDNTVQMKDNEIISRNISRGEKLKIICGGLKEIPGEAQTIWLKDSIPLKPEELATTLMTKLYLLLNRAKEKDSGTYQCQVRLKNEDEAQIDRSVNVAVFEASYLSNSIEKNDPNSSEEDYDLSEEELFQKKQDQQFSCTNVLQSRNRTEENRSYICIDLDNKKEMSHFIVRPTGGTAILYCHFKGNPNPSIQWLKNGVPVLKSYQRKIQKSSLVIEDLTPDDQATYSCRIANNITTIDYEIRLEITERSHSRPVFVKTPGNFTVFSGATVEFQVEILSDPEYFLTWVKHAKDQPENVTEVQSRTINHILEIHPDILILDNVTYADEGWYSCIVGNSMGKAMTSSYLHVQVEELDDETRNGDYIILSPPVLIIMTGAVILFIMFLGLCLYIGCSGGYRCGGGSESDIPKTVKWSKQITVQRRQAEGVEEEGTVTFPDIKIQSVESFEDGPEYYLPMDLKWEFPRSKLTLGRKLGEGAFGEVVEGLAYSLLEPDVVATVAVKKLKPAHTDADLVDLLSECEIMKDIGKHVNVLSLLGCCTEGGELLVLTEYAHRGNLRDYLRKKRHEFLYDRPRINPQSSIRPIQFIPYETDEESINFNDLMSFSHQVARGMQYLTLRKYVHRDIAARNILVCQNKVVKIGDFGMARNTFSNDYYRKKGDGRVPVKWMAPETLLSRYYSSQSDVWAYGILLWEIVTLGGTPYPSMPDVIDLLDFLNSGRRMEQPKNCPTELYLVMRDCWHETPSARPTFGDLVGDVERILNISSGVEYLELDGLQPLDLDEIIITPPDTPEHSASGIQLSSDFVEYINEPSTSYSDMDHECS